MSDSGDYTWNGQHKPPMSLNDYQNAALDTAIYPSDRAMEYLALKLASEAGEVAGKVGKAIRDNGGTMNAQDIVNLALELGDVLWYVAVFAHDICGCSLEEIAQANIAKLASRKARGVIGGSGDDR